MLSHDDLLLTQNDAKKIISLSSLPYYPLSSFHSSSWFPSPSLISSPLFPLLFFLYPSSHPTPLSYLLPSLLSLFLFSSQQVKADLTCGGPPSYCKSRRNFAGNASCFTYFLSIFIKWIFFPLLVDSMLSYSQSHFWQNLWNFILNFLFASGILLNFHVFIWILSFPLNLTAILFHMIFCLVKVPVTDHDSDGCSEIAAQVSAFSFRLVFAQSQGSLYTWWSF